MRFTADMQSMPFAEFRRSGIEENVLLQYPRIFSDALNGVFKLGTGGLLAVKIKLLHRSANPDIDRECIGVSERKQEDTVGDLGPYAGEIQ